LVSKYGVRRLAESDITDVLSCSWMDYVGDKIVAHLVSSSTALASVTNMSEKQKSTTPSAI